MDIHSLIHPRAHAVISLVLLSLLLTPPLHAQGGPVAPVAFGQLAWEAARKKASEEGRPVFVYYSETAEQDDHWLTNAVRGEGVRTRLLECVRFAGSASEIRRIEKAQKGETRREQAGASFARFPQSFVAEHRHARGELARWLKRTGKDPATYVARPLVLLLRPDGTLLSAFGGEMTAKRLAFELELALRASGRGDREQAEKDEAKLADLRKKLRAERGFDQRIVAQELARLPLLAAREQLWELATTRKAKNTRVRLWAVSAAGQRGDLLALPKLAPLLRDRDRRIQQAALRSIGELRVPDSLPVLVRFAPKARHGELAEELPRALLFSQFDADDTVRLVRAALNDKSADIAIAALNAMWEQLEHDERLLETVRELTRERNGAVRDRAAELLRELEKRK